MITKDNDNLLYFRIDIMDKILQAKNKGRKIIESCENHQQLDCAKRYINQYSKTTEDLVGASELEVLLLAKRLYI